MRTYLDFVPPLSVWIVPLGALAVFVIVAELGVRRGWRRPGTSAFWLVWGVSGLAAFLDGWGASEPTRHAHVVPPGVRGTVVALVGAFVLFGAALSGFDRFRPKSFLAGAAAALLAGAASVPIVIIGSLLLACALDLGCI
jgi:hypothetical protein